MSRKFLLLVIVFVMIGILFGVFIQYRRWPIRLLARITDIYHASFSQDDGDVIELVVRDFGKVADPERLGIEVDGEQNVIVVDTMQAMPISQTALVLVDVWDDETPLARREANIRDRLLPLLEAAREHGILIVHAPNGMAMHELVQPLPDEITVAGSDETPLVQELYLRGIRYLLYAGYNANMCVFLRPTGMLTMKQYGFEMILVEDATIAIEVPWSLDGELSLKAITDMVKRNIGVTTTVDDVIAALEELD